MKIITIIATLLASTCTAFAPPSISRRTSNLSSTIEKPETSSSTTTPERVAPDAGYVPEWEGRQGLTPEEFMKSDMSKPDLSGMWECPLTRWDSEG